MRRPYASALVVLVTLLAFGLVAPASGAQQKRGFTVRPPVPGDSRLSSVVVSTFEFGRSDGTSDASFRMPALGAAGSAAAPAEPSTLLAPLGFGNFRVNQDFSRRPHNEPSIEVQGSVVVAGSNDYRVGAPIGGGFYASPDRGDGWVDGLLPFPFLTNDEGVGEPPAGTGDDAVAFARDGTVYQATIGFSYTWCENGVFVYRSTNGGRTWTQPVVPDMGGPLRVVAYYDDGDSCFVDGGPETDVFHDKEWIAVDNSGGSHDGRVYVTWSKFEATDSTLVNYDRAAIMMAYSDDRGDTWSPVVVAGQAQEGEINGSDADFCTYQSDGESAGRCDEDQFSVPVVGPDGSVYVAFENGQNEACWNGSDFRNQYLVVGVTPTGADSFDLSGPYQAVPCIHDGAGDYPTNVSGRQTLSNSNFRVNSAGNLAIDPSNGDLYIVWSDNRNGTAADTDTDVFAVTSTDGGATWSSRARVNKDLRRNGKDQWFPWIAVTADGTAGVVFYDRRLSEINRSADAFLAYSSNRFGTVRNERVSDVSFNLNLGFSGGAFIGDYLGIDLRRCTAYPIWTDSRRASSGERFSDLYGARVPLPACG